jgi:arginine decarboxylase
MAAMGMLETRSRPSLLEQSWSVTDSAELYQIRGWGKGYFAINAAGHVVVRPSPGTDREIDLYEVVEGLRERDMRTPVLVRFTDILTHRLRELHEAFSTAITENQYRGGYTCVYPVKVNQQRPVVEEVFSEGSKYGFGLEVGSKPELLAVMAMTGGDERLIVCNGFKDDPYLEAVVLATKLGRTIVPVVENSGELRMLLRHARRHDVRPAIGVRVKLASQGAGRWRDSAGAKSKFGLFVSEVLEMLEVLDEYGMKECLQLVHCHPGSQLHDVRRVKDAVGELAHVFAELVRLGAPLRYIDVGGGLGVDYDGSRTNFPSSMNYTLPEYASEVVYRIASVCNERGIEHPTIVSESGRAITAYQSVLVFDVLGRTRLDHFRVEDVPALPKSDDDGETPQPIRDLTDAYASVSERRLIEAYHDALQAREEALNLFNLGYLSLELRGYAERVFWATCAKVYDITRKLNTVPEELADLETVLSETYFCNLSVFQSLPDSWAIGQLFPIMPIHRLGERPTLKAVLGDVTCDSDGRIDRFVDVRDIKSSLDLHDIVEGEPYYLGTFLVGAYQETLGDLHNLFGDPHVVHIRLHESAGWCIERVVRGDTAREVLSYVQYEPARLAASLAEDCEHAVRQGRITVAESRRLLRFYEAELGGYTYLETECGDESAG